MVAAFKLFSKTFSTVLTAVICAYSLPLQAHMEEEVMVVDSGEAAYDGKKIILSGNVVVDHELGRMSACEVVMMPPEGEKKLRVGSFLLNGSVRLVLKDGGQLSCSKAHIDYQGLTGKFEGDNANEYVVYMENCRDKANPNLRLPLVLKSRQMSIQIARQAVKGSQSTKSHIQNIIAENQVNVDYNHDFIAAADFASYLRQSPEGLNDPASRMSGLISLKANGPEGLCQVTNRNGDLINASQICIDTLKRQICFAYPQGAIYSNRSEQHPERLDFKADTLSWDSLSDSLILRDHVEVNQKGLGKLTNDKELKLIQNSVNGKKQLATIESEGKTVLTRVEENKNQSHTLTCYGKMVADHANLQISMDSPKDEKGNIAENEQVFFEDPIGVIHADKMKMEYEIVNKSIVPKKLILEGHVKMLNNYAANGETTSPLVQYALADVVEYNPQSKEMMFSSKGKGKRVLFYDKANDLQVSATALKIKRDEVTKKDSVKGIGDVRFCFIEHEFEQLRERFALDKFKEKQEEKNE